MDSLIRAIELNHEQIQMLMLCSLLNLSSILGPKNENENEKGEEEEETKFDFLIYTHTFFYMRLERSHLFHLVLFWLKREREREKLASSFISLV